MTAECVLAAIMEDDLVNYTLGLSPPRVLALPQTSLAEILNVTCCPAVAWKSSDVPGSSTTGDHVVAARWCFAMQKLA